MQADTYGILVGTTGAGFSSRFHARTGAGCRARVLATEEINAEGFRHQLQVLADDLKAELTSFRAGSLVPWEGGEEFVTSGGGTSVVIHADLNAAQNLQAPILDSTRRCLSFERRRSQGRRTGLLVSGKRRCTTPGSIGDAYRWRRLRPPATVRRWRRVHPGGSDEGRWKKVTGGSGAGEEEGLDELALELAEATDDEFERGHEKQVFFRDPSGLVLRADRWYEGRVFWGRVRRRAAQGLGFRCPDC